MIFLIAVVGFLSGIYLAEYAFVELGSNLLGLAALGMIGVGFLSLLYTLRSNQ